jgi:hypothetical protein
MLGALSLCTREEGQRIATRAHREQVTGCSRNVWLDAGF